MKVAVFGATGLFGEEIADVFETRHEVIRFKGVADGDVRFFSEVYEKLQAIQPDLIINATGYRNPDNCKRNRSLAMSINALGPKNLALCAKKLDAAFLHISSDSVFSGNTQWPYSEFDVPDATTGYGHTKIAAEKEIRSMTDKHYIIRVAMLFGFKGAAEENLMFQTWKNAEDGTIMYGATDQICNASYTKDAAEALMVVAESDIYGTYHISNQGISSRNDLLKAFCELKDYSGDNIFNMNSQEKYDPRSTYTVFDPVAFKNTFPQVKLENWRLALQRCYEDYLASGRDK
mgnify:FL=1